LASGGWPPAGFTPQLAKYPCPILKALELRASQQTATTTTTTTTTTTILVEVFPAVVKG
jgi:hypothetical protein